MSVCARLAGSSSHQWGWLRRELAAIDADSRARAEVDSSAVRSEFNAARAKFDPNLDIQLIDSASLPEHLRSLVEKRPSAEGLWNNGSIYLLEDRISPGRVRKVLLHEVVAHEGLRRVFGKDYDTFLRQIVNQYADPISTLAARRRIDITTPNGQLEAADEFLAELAESRLAPDSPESAPAASDSSHAPIGAATVAPGAEAPTLNLQPSTFNSRPQDGQGAEAPLSGSSRAQSPAPRSGSSFHISYFISHISWRSVLASLRAFLRRHGWNLAWTDNDLSALLARSARSVSAQSASNTSAKSTSSDPRFAEQKSRYQDNTMRAPDTEIPVISIPHVPKSLSLYSVEKEIATKIRNNNGCWKIFNEDQNMPIEILSHDSLDEAVCLNAIQETKNDGTPSIIHTIALRNIDILLVKAKLGVSHTDWHTYAKNKIHKNNKEEAAQVHRFFVAMEYDGKVYGIEYTVKEKTNGRNVFYTLEAHSLKENTPENKSSQGGVAKAASPGQSPSVQYNTFFEKFNPEGDLFGDKYRKKYPDAFSPVRFADDPSYEAKAAAIAKILYRYTGTSYLVEPEEAASILAKGGWHLDPVNDEELLRYSAALAVKMKRERALKARHERERNAINNADEWTKLLMEKYGENFKINPGPKYDGSLATVTYTAQSFKDLESDEIITEITVSKLKKVNGIWKIYEEVDKKK